MNRSKDPKYWLQKKSRKRIQAFPVATVAYYGPTDQFATKAAVGILLTEKDEDASFMKKWFTEQIDARLDQAITREILEFIDEHQAARVVMVDRIIGCPHEEGVDYPPGETCPECPFWANRDRWTGELIS